MLTGWRFLGGFADDAPECGQAPPPSSRSTRGRIPRADQAQTASRQRYTIQGECCANCDMSDLGYM